MGTGSHRLQEATVSVPIILAVAAVVVVAVVLGVVTKRQREPQRRSAALVKTGAALMAVFTVFGGAFIGGYAMDEPAGTAPLLLALTAAFVALCVWFALHPTTARSFQDANGPVLAVGVVALAFPAAVLGLKRTGLAGWLLLALGALPLLITIVGRSGPAASLAAASVVPLITGAVYVVAARM